MKLFSLFLLFPCFMFFFGCELEEGNGNSRDRSGRGEEFSRETPEELEARLAQKSMDDALCAAIDIYDPKLEPIDSLLVAGANPNCGCKVHRSRRRLGSYIPIVKNLMVSKTKGFSIDYGALQLATSKADTSMMGLLIRAGAEPNKAADNGVYAISIAAGVGSWKALRYLIAEGADPANVDLSNCRSIKMIDFLMKKGASGKTVNVGIAVGNCSLGKLRKLLKYGPEIKDVDSHHLINFCSVKLLDALLDYGMDANLEVGMHDAGLLMEAVAGDELAHFKRLLEAGADVNHQGVFGKTPLSEAVLDEQVVMVTAMMDHDPIFEWKGHMGRSMNLMEMAISTGNVKMVSLLKDKGVHVGEKYSTDLEFAEKEGAEAEVLAVFGE